MLKFTSSSILVLAVAKDCKTKLHIIEHKRNGDKEEKFSVLLIDNLNEIFKINETFFDSYGISSLNNFIVLAHDQQLLLLDIKTKKLICQTIAKNDKNVKFLKIVCIKNTDNFIALTDDHQIYYLEYNKDQNMLITNIQKDLKATMIEIVKYFMVIYDGASKLSIYSLEKNVTRLSEIRVKNLKFFKLSPESNYLAVYETPKCLSLYRLKDFIKCAQITLYCEITTMVVSEKYVSLGMKNKRLLSYLIVDPLEHSHKTRISELPSRYVTERFFFKWSL